MKTILLADDSLTIQKVVELTFLDEDYEVVSVGSGEDARARLADGPDILITDIHVPGASGYDLCREAKESRPELPVLLLVGTFETLDEERAEQAGADGHLQKPFDAQELLRTVESLVEAAAASAEGEPAAEASGEPEAEGAWAGESPVAAEGSAGEDREAELAADGAATDEPTAFEPVEVSDVERADAVTRSEEPAAEPQAAEAGDDGPQPAPSTEPDAGGEAPTQAVGGVEVTDELVERVARRVAELLGDEIVREVSWEVVPDLAEVAVKERLRELEAEIE